MEKLSPIGWALRPLRKYAVFSGRASRAEFWWFFLFVMVIYIAMFFALGSAAGGLAAMGPSPGGFGAFGILTIFIGLFWLVLLLPALGVQTRRLHDTGRSGWWLVAYYVLYLVYLGTAFGSVFAAQGPNGAPALGAVAATGAIAVVFFIYSIVLLIFFCLAGTKGPNQFGDDPYGPDVEQVFA